jgi:hypothetical protein
MTIKRIPTAVPRRLAAKPVKAVTPKRPSGQFQGKRESLGKVNGGGYGEAVHPDSPEAFEKL